MSTFRPATKRGAKLRCAIFGPSGGGKTFSSLRIATGLGGRIALIDTERHTACKYADRFRFDVCELQARTTEAYTEAIVAARGHDVLIIDSLTHAWRELLEEVDRAAKQLRNRWAGWSEVTPKQKRFIDALLGYPGHLIATMRCDTEWQVANEGGKVKPIRVGLKPEQGKGIEYEFDLLLELSPDHTAQIIKDRTGRYQDKVIERPGEAFGRELADWLASDAPPASGGGHTDGGATDAPAAAHDLPSQPKPLATY